MPSNTYGGGPYFVAAKSGVARKDNGGTVLWGGNVSTTVGTDIGPNVSQALGYTTVGFHKGAGSIIYNSTSRNVGVYAGGNNFNVMTKGTYVMTIVSTTLGGLSNTTLQSGASDGMGRVSQNYYIGNIRTTRYIMTGGWYYQTGQAVAKTDFVDSLTTETFPTRAIPGRLTYLVTGKLPKNDSYKAKND